jgi:hypothetical protein
MLFMGDRGEGVEISEENSCQNATDIQKIGAVWGGLWVIGVLILSNGKLLHISDIRQPEIR